MSTLLKMLSQPPHHPDWTDALEAYVQADKVRERAREAFEKADEVAQQRETELRAIFDRLTDREAAPTGAGQGED